MGKNEPPLAVITNRRPKGRTRSLHNSGFYSRIPNFVGPWGSEGRRGAFRRGGCHRPTPNFRRRAAQSAYRKGDTEPRKPQIALRFPNFTAPMGSAGLRWLGGRAVPGARRKRRGWPSPVVYRTHTAPDSPQIRWSKRRERASRDSSAAPRFSMRGARAAAPPNHPHTHKHTRTHTKHAAGLPLYNLPSDVGAAYSSRTGSS